MRRMTLFLLLFGFLIPLSPVSLTAQQSSKDDAAQLRSLVAQPTRQERDRATVRDFLRSPSVRKAATSHGIDINKLQARVGTLDSTDAADIAQRIRDANESPVAQAGGDTFVITSTTVIIILLVLILIAVS